MKRLFIILIMVAGFTRAEAQSMIRVHLTDNTPINVALDGRYFNKKGTGVTVGDLPPGRHLLQIYSLTQNRRGRAFEEVIYEGKVKTYDGLVTLFEFDPASGGTSVSEQDMSTYNGGAPAAGNSQPQGQYDNGGNNTSDKDERFTTPDVAPVSPEKIGTLTDTKIDNLKTKVTAKNTDTEKMNLMKEALKDEKVTTSQVGFMMDWFEFESSKVDFAKWAYNNTVDKEYFNDLDSKFTYKNYQDDLDKFIQSNNK